MDEEWGYSRTRATIALAVAGMAVALVALVGAAVVYMAMRIAILDKETARLQTAQAELKDAVQALQASASAAPTAPAPAPAAPPPAANASPPPPTAVPATSAAQQAGQPQPAPAADRYSVRIFAAADTSNKNKLERFVNVVRSLGFDVDVSQTNISDSINSSILYQPSALNVANKLANSLKARYPALNFEMNTGAVNDNLKRVLIVSLNQDALN